MGTTGGQSWARVSSDLRNTAKGLGSEPVSLQTSARHNAPQQPSPRGWWQQEQGRQLETYQWTTALQKTSISPQNAPTARVAASVVCPSPVVSIWGWWPGEAQRWVEKPWGGCRGPGEGSVGSPPRCRSQKRRGGALRGTGTAGRLDCVPRRSHGTGRAAGPRAGPGPTPGARTGRHWRKEPQGQRPVGTTGLRDRGAWCLATSALQLHPSPNQRWRVPSPQQNVSVNTFGQTRAKRVGEGVGKVVVILN